MATNADTYDADLLDRIIDWYRNWYDEDIGRLAQRFPADQTVLELDYSALRRGLPDLARDYLDDPDTIRDYLEEALALYDLPVAVDLGDATVRVTGLSDAAAAHVTPVGDYSPAEVAGEFTVLTGQVAKRSQTVIRPTRGVWKCSRCGEQIRRPIERGEPMPEPHECPGCERQGPFVEDAQAMAESGVNHQLIRLQRPPEHADGHDDATLDVVLEEDLAKTVSPGDRVTVGAELDPRLEDGDDDRPEIDFLGLADSIEQRETDFEDIDYHEHEDRIQEVASSADPYTTIIDSILPSHEGHPTIKEAIMYQLFGGVEKTLPDGTETRGTIHLFLVGDPGVGKSTLLNYVRDLAPRSVFTTGTGSTAAGLTCAAVQDDFGDGGWSLEAGALVEAHNGIACIDELDDMDEEDRAGMLESMSDQQISVTKAGMQATMPANTTVLAAANPDFGRFDPYEPFHEQIDIHPALFSRFDLVFPMLDSPDADTDEAVAETITTSQQVGGRLAGGQSGGAEEVTPPLEPEELRAYIARARECYPEITDEAKAAIKQEYVEVRSANEDTDSDAVPTTPRMLECLTRLAEASARVRLAEEVAVDDVQRACDLYRSYLGQFGMDIESGTLDVDRIETGTSAAQRDRVKQTVAVIEELAEEYDEGAPTRVVKQSPEIDADEEQVEAVIENLKQKGEVYTPTEGHLRTT
jgi:replicative DNA helicase Mcm